MKYDLLPEAQQEFDGHAARYSKIDPALGSDFQAEVIRSIGKIIDFPKAHTEVEQGIRCCLTDRFPYKVFYHFEQRHQYILVIAIMHARQRPGYWRTRL